MLARARLAIAASIAAIGAAAAPAAQAAPEDQDYSASALNIIPSGQFGSLPVPAGADRQAQMYDGLTPLFDQVTDADLTTYFKSAKFGIADAGPGVDEPVPRPGVTITRDAYNVPHVVGATHEDGIWAAGWIAAADRGLLLEQARFNARVAAVDVPGVTAIALISELRSFTPSAELEAELAGQTDELLAAGPEGQAVLADIDTYIEGINAYRAANGPAVPPWTRNDIYAVNALKGQFLGQGGGDEARRSQFFAGLRERHGKRRAKAIFNDLRQFTNRELPTSIDGTFPYGSLPKRPRGNVVIDPGSFTETPAVPPEAELSRTPYENENASNTLMIDAKRSATGSPLMVGGPQIGYFYPGFTLEIDMHTPDMDWRGATSAPFPGYMLIGRGPDFATTLTSASGDIVDQYAERLCGKSRTTYRYRGKCREMELFNAGTIASPGGPQPVTFLRTVHGPVVGYARVDGRRVAISSKRSSYGKDVLDQLFFRRLSNGQVSSPKTFFEAAALTPQTFNSFYIDNSTIAEFTSGRLPIRPKSVDPGLLTDGSGEYEWRGFLADSKHPQGTNPRDGTITNWNQTVAKGFGAADDEWGRNGSAARNDLLDNNLARLEVGGKWTLAAVTAAMNAAATQDIRAIDTVPLLKRLLRGSKARSERARAMLAVLVDWKRRGGSRLDRDLDGRIDDPGAAVMDGSWDRIANALMRPRIGAQLGELDSLFSRFDQPPGGQYSGWYQYFDRDIRALLGERVKQPFNLAYCGKGNLARCQRSIWTALEKSGERIAAAQGSNDPDAWRADATAERIEFIPGLLATTMRYANRPSGIQQLVSFDRGR